jgi:outer membrane PBP1 activator LpoA protein
VPGDRSSRPTGARRALSSEEEARKAGRRFRLAAGGLEDPLLVSSQEKADRRGAAFLRN